MGASLKVWCCLQNRQVGTWISVVFDASIWVRLSTSKLCKQLFLSSTLQGTGSYLFLSLHSMHGRVQISCIAKSNKSVGYAILVSSMRCRDIRCYYFLSCQSSTDISEAGVDIRVWFFFYVSVGDSTYLKT